MAAVRNPTNWSLFSHVLHRSLAPGEIVDHLDDETAEAACAAGIFEQGLIIDEPEHPVRKTRSKRGGEVVEEAVEDERETR